MPQALWLLDSSRLQPSHHPTAGCRPQLAKAQPVSVGAGWKVQEQEQGGSLQSTGTCATRVGPAQQIGGIPVALH